LALGKRLSRSKSELHLRGSWGFIREDEGKKIEPGPRLYLTGVKGTRKNKN